MISEPMVPSLKRTISRNTGAGTNGAAIRISTNIMGLTTQRIIMSKPLMLFRSSREVDYELPHAERYFNVFQNRCSIGVGGLVVCRYSALPFYKELEDDLSYLGCKPINSYEQHHYIANFDYYNDIKDLTPETWFSPRDVVRSGYQGPFVLKGRTNSRKYNWNTHMYAPTLSDLWRVDTELRNDGLLGYQDIIY